MIIRSPLHKVIRNIKRSWIWARVLEINNNYLDTTEWLVQCRRKVQLRSFILLDDDPWGSVDEGSSATDSHTACHCAPAPAY